jgi:hypothetical protein
MRNTVFYFLLAFCTSGWANNINEEALIDAGMAHRPRNVPELISMIRQHQPTVGALEKLRVASVSEPAQNLYGDALGDFYFRRAQSQVALGDPHQAIRDLRRAIDAFGPEVRRKRMLAQNQMIRMLDLSDQTAESNAELRIVVSEWSDLPWAMAKQVSAYSDSGDFLQARHLLGDLKKACTWKLEEHPFWCSLMSTHVEQASGHLSAKENRNTDALRHYRSALQHAHDSLTHFATVPKAETPPTIEVVRLSIDIHRLRLAKHLMAMSRYVEAEWQAAEVLTAQLNRSGALGPDVADAAMLLAELLSARSKHEEAFAIASEAMSFEQRNGRKHNDKFQRKMVELQIARLIDQSRDKEAATLVKTLIHAGENRQTKTCDCIWPEQSIIALLKNRDFSYAEKMASDSIAQLKKVFSADQFLLSRLQAYRAIATVNLNPSIADLTSSTVDHPFIALLFQTRKATEQLALHRVNRSDTTNIGKRIAFIAESHIQLLWKLKKGNAAFEALKLAELAKLAKAPNYHLLHLNGLSSFDQTSTNLIRSEENLLERIRSLELIALRLQSDMTPMNRVQTSEVWNKVAELDAERIKLVERLLIAQPKYAERILENTDTHLKLQAALHKNEALVATHVTDKETYIWAIHSGKPMIWHVSKISRTELTVKVNAITKGMDPSLWLEGKPPAFDLQQAASLYTILFTATFTQLRDVQKLVMVPDGPIAALPINALIIPRKSGQSKQSTPPYVNWLAKNYAVALLQTTASFSKLRSQETLPTGAHATTFLGVGDPIFSMNASKKIQLADATGSVFRKTLRSQESN